MRKQSPFEERLNTITHAFGALFGVLALLLLVSQQTTNVPWHFFAVWVYGLSMVLLFSASALYHYVRSEHLKHYFRILDHVSIYILIAGTYTPVTLITLAPSRGWYLFLIVWSIAAFGTLLKIFFTGRFEVFSLVLYLAMGWLIVFDFTYLATHLHANGLFWLFAGGLAYTVGVLFYAIHRIKFNHVIWHLFVLAGAICHFIMVYKYVI
ncbi:hemolysin III family protein [Bizionia sediminis]|uniref:Hemolysin III family protein n=1 Tax=Bizionia sediminis TaxID=1737064 RepID=A0ABW5KVE2_9FLAO